MFDEVCIACHGHATPQNSVLLLGVHETRTMQCEDCGCLWRNPMPSQQALTAYYRGNDSRYSAEVQLKMAYSQSRWALAHCDAAHAPLRVVEYGAGGGWLLNAFAESPLVAGVLGIEPHTSTNQPVRGIRMLDGVVGEVLVDQPDPTVRTDMVVMAHVFEHLADPLGTLRTLSKVHGKHILFLEVPDAQYEAEAIISTKTGPSSLDQHLWSYTAAGLTSLLTGVGYEIRALERVGAPSFWRHYVRGQRVRTHRAELRNCWLARSRRWRSLLIGAGRLGLAQGERIVGYPAARRLSRPDLPCLRLFAVTQPR